MTRRRPAAAVRRGHRQRTTAALALSVAVLLGGCTGQAEPEVVHVQITDSGFDPPLTVVAPGTEVRFWSNSPHVHTVTSSHQMQAGEPTLPEGAEAFDSGRLRHGQAFSHSFDVVGDHVFWCEIHRDQQWYGVVRVSQT